MPSHAAWVAALAAYGAYIWLHDPRALGALGEMLPTALALPLFVAFGRPWNLEWRRPVKVEQLAAAAALFAFGTATGLQVLLAASWTMLLWAWLSSRLSDERCRAVRPLLALTLLAFPWIALDLAGVGWWFRLSGAWAANLWFSALGFEVIRSVGTQLQIGAMPVSVSAPCSGLNTLQSLLVAGIAVAYAMLGPRRIRLWLNVPLLIAAAWIANTARIIALCSAGILVSPEFAAGAFHTVGGLLVVVVMLVLSSSVMQLEAQARWLPRPS